MMAPAIVAALATPIRAMDASQNPSDDMDFDKDAFMDAEKGSDKPMTPGDYEPTSPGNSDRGQDMTMHLEHFEVCELAQREAADRVVCDASRPPGVPSTVTTSRVPLLSRLMRLHQNFLRC